MPTKNSATSKSVDFDLINDTSTIAIKANSPVASVSASVPPRSSTMIGGVVRKRSWRTHYVRPQKSLDHDTYHVSQYIYRFSIMKHDFRHRKSMSAAESTQPNRRHAVTTIRRIESWLDRANRQQLTTTTSQVCSSSSRRRTTTTRRKVAVWRLLTVECIDSSSSVTEVIISVVCVYSSRASRLLSLQTFHYRYYAASIRRCALLVMIDEIRFLCTLINVWLPDDCVLLLRCVFLDLSAIFVHTFQNVKALFSCCLLYQSCLCDFT